MIKQKRMYALKLTNQSVSVHTVQLHCEQSPEQRLFFTTSNGLGTVNDYKEVSFKEKQNESLKQQFETSEQCGRKADPNNVSKLKRSARD